MTKYDHKFPVIKFVFKLWLRHSLRVFMLGGQWKCFISLKFFSWPSFII